MEKPEFVTKGHLEFLDGLRESGVTNMLGAAPYIRQAYPELTKTQARKVLVYWIETFAERQEEKEEDADWAQAFENGDLEIGAKGRTH